MLHTCVTFFKSRRHTENYDSKSNSEDGIPSGKLLDSLTDHLYCADREKQAACGAANATEWG
jgi:hypothetical protein